MQTQYFVKPRALVRWMLLLKEILGCGAKADVICVIKGLLSRKDFRQMRSLCVCLTVTTEVSNKRNIM